MGGIGHIEYKDKVIYQDRRVNALVMRDDFGEERLSVHMQSRLYGYGGGEFASCQGKVFHVGAQALWQGKTCLAKGVFGDLVGGEQCVWGILEKKSACYIFQYQLATGQILNFKRPEGFLASNIVLNPKNDDQIAFIEWDRQWMPWDQSHLVIKEGVERRVDNPYGANIQQVDWIDDNTLVMVAAVGNWWNLVSYHIKENRWEVLAPRAYDCVVPLWGRGERTLGVFERQAFFCEQQEGQHVLQVFDIDQSALTAVNCPLTHIQELRIGRQGQILIKGGDPWHNLALWHSGEQFITPYEKLMPDFNLHNMGGSVPAWLYWTQDHQAIVVMAHGGPTGQHALLGDDKIAALLSNQISVCALDYHGSTGKGADFRNSLYNQWGQIDVDDCVSLIQALQKRFPKLPIFLKGNSAGAMTCLLTAAKIRVAGVFMRYPVLNISALLDDDALFEGQYLKRLLSKALHRLDLVEYAAQGQCPLLIQQGDDDPVVAADDVFKAVKQLAQRNIDVQYVLHQGQGHGFHSQEVLLEAQQHEIEFIRQWSQNGSRQPIEY